MAQHLFVEGIPKSSPSLVQQMMFFFAGQLMASSFLQEGPTPNVLSGFCYNIMINTNRIEETEVPLHL